MILQILEAIEYFGGVFSKINGLLASSSIEILRDFLVSNQKIAQSKTVCVDYK